MGLFSSFQSATTLESSDFVLVGISNAPEASYTKYETDSAGQ
jgi:hypothetical protein